MFGAASIGPCCLIVFIIVLTKILIENKTVIDSVFLKGFKRLISPMLELIAEAIKVLKCNNVTYVESKETPRIFTTKRK